MLPWLLCLFSSGTPALCEETPDVCVLFFPVSFFSPIDSPSWASSWRGNDKSAVELWQGGTKSAKFTHLLSGKKKGDNVVQLVAARQVTRAPRCTSHGASYLLLHESRSSLAAPTAALSAARGIVGGVNKHFCLVYRHLKSGRNQSLITHDGIVRC